jgi:hypothetical protein
MVRYTIRTEDKPDKRRDVQILVGKVFDGATFLYGDGLWKGWTERSMVIEIVAYGESRDLVYKLAEAIRALLDQEAVMVEWVPVETMVLTTRE